MIKSTGFLILSLFIFASLANLSSGNEIDLNEKNQRDSKKEDKHEYYLNRHVDHPDVDAETIQKHGASLEDAKMQADGLLEPKGKKVKVAGEKAEDSESKLQEMIHGEEKQHQRRHHRHEVKGHKKSEGSMESEESFKKEVTKEKKSNKNRKTIKSNNDESLKSEEVKVDSSKDTENVKTPVVKEPMIKGEKVTNIVPQVTRIGNMEVKSHISH
ncbi:uncharacterized protein LOC128393226 [Panonychus citri]|uniref:uncharacterized protein LOC128393226 n=1 Tax=Panonychus citri TaxID=50023 RepID=UPI00230758E4|nr:uncharacterized protein LOC128393226 [Panonychus citri]